MKKAIKYSILGLAALCTVLLCGGSICWAIP